jgi:solute carrier family 13 (sodium-dependent dicarboxylate transporter), member 2/3/5
VSIDPLALSGAPAGKRGGFWFGLVAGGAIVALAPLLATPGVSTAAWRCVGITVLVACWWVTEAIPLAATALVPAALFPLFGISAAKNIAPTYASSFVLLLLGGFLLAMAVERSGVHRRLALYVLLGIGTSSRRLVLGFTVASGAISLWISNTATTLILMPIAMALVDRATQKAGDRAQGFGVAVLLGTAYGASIGGIGTPIGTPPNLIAIGALQAAFPNGPTWTFVEWVSAALPVVVVLLPLTWLILTRIALRVPADLDLGAAELIRKELEELGPWRAIERRSLAVFGLAAILWITREDVVLSKGSAIPGWATIFGLGSAPDDATVALVVALIAFIIPAGEPDRSRLLPWSIAVKAPWDLVLLFGGGVALAKGFDDTGLSKWIGVELATLGQSSIVAFVTVGALVTTFASELLSNTALANLTMPVLATAVKELSIDPRLLLFPTCLACSSGFMMPAATGPNAIVFGTGRMRIMQMARAGIWMDMVAWVVIVIVSFVMYG